MKKYSFLKIFTGIVLLLMFACENDSPDTLDPFTTLYDNIPIVVNTLNAYTFTVNANNFSMNRVDNLSFETDSILLSLTLANYSNGNGTLSVLSDDSTQIISETLNQLH